MSASDEIQKKDNRQTCSSSETSSSLRSSSLAARRSCSAQLFTGHVKTPQEYRTVTLTAGTYAATVTSEGTIGPDIKSWRSSPLGVRHHRQHLP